MDNCVTQACVRKAERSWTITKFELSIVTQDNSPRADVGNIGTLADVTESTEADRR